MQHISDSERDELARLRKYWKLTLMGIRLDRHEEGFGYTLNWRRAPGNVHVAILKSLRSLDGLRTAEDYMNTCWKILETAGLVKDD